jgi:hypothetical protein
MADLGLTLAPSIDIADTYVPKPAERKQEIFDATIDGDVEKFIAALAAEMR